MAERRNVPRPPLGEESGEDTPGEGRNTDFRDVALLGEGIGEGIVEATGEDTPQEGRLDTAFHDTGEAGKDRDTDFRDAALGEVAIALSGVRATAREAGSPGWRRSCVSISSPQ